MAKRFALLSFGVLCLMLSALIGYHIGNRPAAAQSGVQFVAYNSTFHNNSNSNERQHFAMTSSGDIYYANSNGQTNPLNQWSYLGNIIGGTVPTAPETWGGVKGKYDND